ncbi:hypothetical protein GJU43_00470 [Flavobacterium sp. LC2016-23]|uniref:hypothetical protein n=1 Tax=Flavobacterium sp. LC2016-23 TaxID=2666330 RepID=UPI0012B0E508|nr:hypothetical protein [Flavobacterium sp. LC2016-23]MRX37735.1 hypothetical protein [Flavobacterium sp. LC2016-23]
MKKLQKKLYFLILFGLFLNIYSIHSQTNNEISTYNWFDKNLGIESLDLKNGPAHLNFDKTAHNQNRYYIDDFKNGSVTYNGQDYFDLYLKYDIYADELVLKPYSESNTTKINIVKDYVSSFKIGNQKFINLKELNSTNFKKGYYEEVNLTNNTTLYIKYYKERNNAMKENISYIEYLPKYDYILLKEKDFHLINEKKEIIKLYPDDKRKINDFYFKNRNLKKEDPSLFIKSLMKYINNLNL